jgi:murein hydrolase activator
MLPVRRLTVFLAGFLACCALQAPLTGRAAEPRHGGRGKQAETEAQLEAVQAEIAQARAEATRRQAEADRTTRELKHAELSVAAARQALAGLEAERARRAAERTALAGQRAQHQSRIAAERMALESEVRAAYLMGRSEPLKLLLNQEDPSRAGRMLAYYGYFGRARAGEIARIEADVRQLDTLDRELAGEDERLAALEAQRHDELGQLEQSRAQRRNALASLESESRTSAARLERLQRERSGLESLLRELKRAIEAETPAEHGAFARLRGQLAWPVAGRLESRYGETRAGGLRWDGELIDTQRGAEVRAVSEGRVIFADWLPGLGLLIIIDHGDGYLSLYGHNERLYAAVGAAVKAGEPIAAAGDSGGSPHPELYFEIRKAGRPIDPRQWFRAPSPASAPAVEAARAASAGR